MDNNKFYKKLVQRYHSGEANEQEIALFLELLRTGQIDDIMDRHMNGQLNIAPVNQQRIRFYTFLKYAVVILVLMLAGGGLYYKRYQQDKENEIAKMNNIGPAIPRAMLKLADGRNIILDSTFGELVVEDSTILDKSGKLVHEGENEIYEVSVPRGGTFHLSLSDGSKVWLNSGSSLKFPQKFAADLRKIELKGEAFFEIRKQSGTNGTRIPFVVQTAKQTIEVLGTSFNVKSYGQENEESTLFTGIVKVKNNSTNHEALLSPGNSAILEENGQIKIRKADLEEIASWRSDAFVFYETNIKEILNQLSRWYDVDIVFVGSSDYQFNGYVQRNVSLGEALETLKGTGELDYQYKDRKVIINRKK